MESSSSGLARRTNEEESLHRGADRECSEGVGNGLWRPGNCGASTASASSRSIAGRLSTTVWKSAMHKRLRQLEKGNRKLKQLVPEQALELDIVGFEAVFSKKR